MTPDRALAEIEALEKFGIDLGLERVEACLEALGDPHLGYPCVHIGGTNGKGSTAALVASALTACGLRTGLFTSPPLEFFGERIRVNGELLPRAEVPSLYQKVREAGAVTLAASGMTQFEIITVMALLHFARAEVDMAVVEVGLGGRLDSTNVVHPAVAVITNIGMEHAEHLGDSVAQIAREKGGIIKPGVPLVTAAREPALAVLEGLAAERGADMYTLGRHFHAVARSPGNLDYRGLGKPWDGVEYQLKGPHQTQNVATALATAEVLATRGWPLPPAAVREGIAETTWPGRLEVCGVEPAVVLDGAHNPHAAEVLATALRDEFTYRQLWLVLGVLDDKDARSILTALLPLADHVLLTCSSSRRAFPEGALAELACQLQGRVPMTSPDVRASLDSALAHAAPEDLICVTGSLTVVGEARGHLRQLGRVT